ncbi:hypothetical protein GUJ93_ZPchr0004g38291 [Zizania palustris]|uniref:Uncharacterized protein n=1 Tax=Zizania palustris TaxID=103762 RepID=A0A8J5S688_ZIZPA|nr:hypothetical protein GUJ93_ZPchr0004g38291 [Zizania palustris]
MRAQRNHRRHLYPRRTQRNHSPAFFSGVPSSFAAYPSLHALLNILPSLIRPATSILVLLRAHGNDELAFEIDKNLAVASIRGTDTPLHSYGGLFVVRNGDLFVLGQIWMVGNFWWWLVLGFLADIELACKQKVVFGNLKNGNAALKSIPSEINIDDVQKLMDGTTEAKAYQDLVDRATNRRYPGNFGDQNGAFLEYQDSEHALDPGRTPTMPASQWQQTIC